MVLLERTKYIDALGKLISWFWRGQERSDPSKPELMCILEA